MKGEYKVDNSCNNTCIGMYVLFCVNLERDIINGGRSGIIHSNSRKHLACE
jgi:hypothetical protein